MGFPCGLVGCSQEVEKGLCGGCRSIHYCCKEHQKEDWKRHKMECKGKGGEAKPKKGGEAKPKFHLEYKEAYPGDQSGFSTLSYWFVFLEMMGWNLPGGLPGFQGCVLNSFGTVEEVLVKRWKCIVAAEPGLLEFLRREGKTLGTVWRDNPKLARSIPYGTGFLSDGTSVQMLQMQSMRNTPSPKLQLERGETYVSLGFVDLQELMEADMDDPAENGPIAWHGYDMNPIAVGRSKLILAMLEEDAPLDQVLQIWFSTCISSETAKTLAAFCQKLRMSERDKDVGVLLDWWSRVSNSIKVKVSTDAWNEGRREGAFTSIPLLLSKRDRVEYAHYILTGQIFLAGAKDLVGNPTFLPNKHLSLDFTPPKNESIFNTLNISEELVSEGSLLASIEKRFLYNLANLRKRIKDKEIKISLSVATISADNKAVLTEIQRLKPAGIAWSNIPDYFTIPQFFSIASQCSVEGTQHSFHLMNWLGKVYGGNLADYVPVEENYGRRNFNLNGSFKDSGGALPKLVEELKSELMSQHQAPTGITQDIGAVVSLMNIMNLSMMALGFRYYDTYMKFMFEGKELTRKEWKRGELSVFGFSSCTVYASFQF